MKIAVLGAGGVVGQHMMLRQPDGIEAVFTRRNIDDRFYGFEVETDPLDLFLKSIKPDVVINLIGENRVDIVESDPDKYRFRNVDFVSDLVKWVYENDKKLIHCSTQGVFSGENAPYRATSVPHPITEYGKQKYESELIALSSPNTQVVRLTFVLGIRPFQDIGRLNPAEQMIIKDHQLQVNDRFFSPLFATDAAKSLWGIALGENQDKIIHLGEPLRCTRFSIASDLKHYSHGGLMDNKIEGVSHEYFTGIAPRPKDTTWAYGATQYNVRYEDAILELYLTGKKLRSENELRNKS